MVDSQSEKCKGHNLCNRKPYSGELCEFHLPVDHEMALTCDDYDTLLLKEVEEAVENKNGKYELRWHGFNFPKGHILFEHVKFHAVTDRLAKSWINIQESNIQDILITNNIDTLILSDATIHADTIISVVKIDIISMKNTKFLGKFHCASKTLEFKAPNAMFYDEFSFAASIHKIAIFTNCRFLKSCTFHGVAGFVFEDDGDNKFKVAGFDSAIFGKPKETLFQDVDLRMASFKSVSLIGVRFYNTKFYQQELLRNGLYNEVVELKRINDNISRKIKSKQTESSKKRFKNLIHEYRQLRMAMENNKNYIKAHDFYVGEMEARQRLENNFILVLYRFSSYFGTNYVRAFGILACLFLLHFSLTIILSTNWQVKKLCFGSDIVAAWGRLADIAIHSLSTGTLQRIGLLKDLSGWQNFVDILFRVMIPVQVGMFILALRNKTKR